MIPDNLRNKLETIVERYNELTGLLSDPNFISNQEQFRNASIEYNNLQSLVESYNNLRDLEQKIEQTKLLIQEDPELKQLAEDELNQCENGYKNLIEHIYVLLLPKDPDDHRNVFLEIRSGAGGDEASIFVGDLTRMYLRFAEFNKWRTEIISARHSDQGGYKEIVIKISGQNVYAKLKFESGVHRVQRVPATEAQGRIHTSTVTVAVLIEADEVDAIKINPDDIKVDTYRASGAGGQHVNKTDSAIRITHFPTGIVVECQDERSQHKNRAKAMALLCSKLLHMEQTKRIEEQARNRKEQVGTGERSERIRTYNFPQNRVTDHRINLTIYKLGDLLEGELEQMITPLIQNYQINQLVALGLIEH